MRAELRRSPTVSVVIPTHNRPERMRSVLRDLSLQIDAPPFEVICVCDGGDVSQYAPVLSGEWPFRLRVIHTPRRGPGGARNRGLDRAEATIVAWCEDDVEVDARWLAEGTRAILAGEADAVDGEVLTAQPAKPHAPLRRGEGLRTAPAFLPCNLFVRRNLAVAVGGFDEGYFDDELYFREDSDFGFRLLAAGARVVVEPRAVVRHPPQFFDRASIDRHLQRYRMDARLYRRWPELYRKSIERKKLGPIPLRRPLHWISLLWALSVVAAIAAAALGRWSITAAALVIGLAAGLAFHARYARPAWRGLLRPQTWWRSFWLPCKHLRALIAGARRFGGWGVLLP